MKITLRYATVADMPAIAEIYNDAILKTSSTFDTQTKTPEDRKAWFEKRSDRHPVLVAEVSGRVVAWASLNPWSDRCAYADTAEVSTYVHPEFRGMKIGLQIKSAIIEEGRKLGFHTILSRIVTENTASAVLNKKLGFSHVGTMREVGKKFGRLHDVALYQLIYR